MLYFIISFGSYQFKSHHFVSNLATTSSYFHINVSHSFFVRVRVRYLTPGHQLLDTKGRTGSKSVDLCHKMKRFLIGPHDLLLLLSYNTPISPNRSSVIYFTSCCDCLGIQYLPERCWVNAGPMDPKSKVHFCRSGLWLIPSSIGRPKVHRPGNHEC
jgi:hypothetical protein